MKDSKTFEVRKNQLFSALLGQTWENKQIWEHIRDGNLIATPAFEGSKYRESAIKIMFIGRALNGWNKELGDCSSLEETVHSILAQKGALNTFVDSNGFGDGPRKYKHKNSRFFRFIKHILEDIGESESGIEETFYNDKKEWNQRFVWANLYCIAPKNPVPGTNANPSNRMIKPSVNYYIDLMEVYIKYYQPDVVVFVTDVEGWFIKWTRERSFKDIVDNYQEFSSNDIIRASGTIDNSRIIVCKRPDRRGTTYNEVEEMANIISTHILGRR